MKTKKTLEHNRTTANFSEFSVENEMWKMYGKKELRVEELFR